MPYTVLLPSFASRTLGGGPETYSYLQIAVGLGTHGYRAPEQDSVTIQSFDLRTDLWGVGATAWSLYTGIDLNRRQDVLRRERTGNVFGLARLSDVALRCPPPLEEVICKGFNGNFRGLREIFGIPPLL